MSIIKWRPFHELEDFFNDKPLRGSQWDLAIDVYEEHGNIIAKMNIPGIDSEKIDIDVKDKHLHIRGERAEEKEVSKKDYFYKEIRRGSFERIVPIPCAVNKEKVTAEMHDGVLMIIMPKAKEEQLAEKRIKVIKK